MLEAGTHDPRELAEAARRAIVPDLLRRKALGAASSPQYSIPSSSAGSLRCGAGMAPEASEPSTALAVRDRIERVRSANAAGSSGGRLYLGAAARACRVLVPLRG